MSAKKINTEDKVHTITPNFRQVDVMGGYTAAAGSAVAYSANLPARLQGKDITPLLDDPKRTVRGAAFSVAPSSKGFLLRDDKWAYLQYAEDASQGIELFDMIADPKQYTNLAGKPEFATVVEEFKGKLAAKLRSVRDNDLGRN